MCRGCMAGLCAAPFIEIRPADIHARQVGHWTPSRQIALVQIILSACRCYGSTPSTPITHIPLSPLQRGAVAVFSAVGALAKWVREVSPCC